MSNQEKLQDAMNFLDEKIIAEAAPDVTSELASEKAGSGKIKRFPWKTVVGLAATLVVVAGATLAFTLMKSREKSQMEACGKEGFGNEWASELVSEEIAQNNQKVDTKTADVTQEETSAPSVETSGSDSSQGTAETKPETHTLPQWDEQEDWERYIVAILNAKEYRATQSSNSAEYIEKELPELAIVQGWDWYKDEIHEKNAKAFAITKVSPELAIAVRFEEGGATYVYANMEYVPKTLGELMTAVNLEEDLVVQGCYREVETDGKWKILSYDSVSAKLVKELLLSDRTVANETGVDDPSSHMISLSVRLSCLGERLYSIWLTEGGYLGMNILETEKRFFIGKDCVKAFVEYVMENHPWCEYEYDSSSEGEITIE